MLAEADSPPRTSASQCPANSPEVSKEGLTIKRIKALSRNILEVGGTKFREWSLLSLPRKI